MAALYTCYGCSFPATSAALPLELALIVVVAIAVAACSCRCGAVLRCVRPLDLLDGLVGCAGCSAGWLAGWLIVDGCSAVAVVAVYVVAAAVVVGGCDVVVVVVVDVDDVWWCG